MGALRDSARTLGDELGDYYVAALEFIDPELVADSPLEDILAAATRRRRKLNERPLYQAEDELNALEEALHFVQRVRTDLPSSPVHTSADYIDVDIDGSEPAGISPAELWARALAPGNTPVAAEPEPPVETGDSRDGERAPLFAAAVEQPVAKPGPVAKAAAAARPVAPPPGKEWVIPADRTKATVAPATTPATPLERPSLREVMETAHRSTATLQARRRPPQATVAEAEPAVEVKTRRTEEPAALPESLAWPVVAGLGLIAWQAWLAAFTGWTATRFFVWPRPGVGYELGWPAAAGLVVLALATALLVGRTAWLQRRRTRRLAFLVHFSGVAVVLNLIAWHRAAGHLGALIDGPTAVHYVLLGLGWAVAWALAVVHDALQKRNAERRV